MALSADDEIFVAEVRDAYEALLSPANGRVRRSDALWNQFEAVVADYANGNAHERTLLEKVNELAVASEIAMDPTLRGTIEYEPDILPSGRRIDFVADRGKDLVYVEVKTVRPEAGDEEENRRLYAARTVFHPENVHYIVGGDIGGTIYANSFRARAHFLDYSLEFESRLAEARENGRGGPGILVFCGTGFQWRVDELEDFADFYHAGSHRQDDAFGPMEAHNLAKRRVTLTRIIDHFAFLKRPANLARRTEFHFPVKGPWFLGPQMGGTRQGRR